MYFIDFGLGYFSEIIEDQGVDLLLFKKAVDSTHYQYCDEAMGYFFEGYSSLYGDINPLHEKMSEIEKRGRYHVRN